MANWFYYDASGDKVGPVTGSSLKALAQQGVITPGTTIENDEGVSAVARKIKGLTFSESTPPLADSNPFSAAMPVEANPFSAAMPVVKQAVAHPTSLPWRRDLSA